MTTLAVAPSVLSRFWKKVDTSGDCWIWTACTDDDGYGRFTLRGENVKAHRFIYEVTTSIIAAGLQIDHRCHVEACVRPTHLRVATNKQNAENTSGAYANSKSGVRGVYWHRPTKKWVAQVTHNGKKYHAGLFADLDDAAAAVTAKRLELFTHNDSDRK